MDYLRFIHGNFLYHQFFISLRTLKGLRVEDSSLNMKNLSEISWFTHARGLKTCELRFINIRVTDFGIGKVLTLHRQKIRAGLPEVIIGRLHVVKTKNIQQFFNNRQIMKDYRMSE